ncbi:MAG: hypothetical protein LBI48_02155 [Burkholderiaceae bacterium]|jgi:hypothetical protein|nr:hypothetical protein [Burkholderiaceae bacterium]
MTDEHEQQELHRSRVRMLLRWRAEHGGVWVRQWVKDCPWWAAVKPDVLAQWRLGNRGAHGDWRQEAA